MQNDLKIDCRWLGRETGSAVERNFYADIAIGIGDEWLTKLEDISASTVRDSVRACAHQLALWFASNWWRLRWEPETRTSKTNLDWLVAHSMASAGGGYVWPNIFFASDGSSVAVASIPRLQSSPFEPVRYLNRLLSRITTDNFEQRVDGFIDMVLSRMHSCRMDDKVLPELWAEVLAERQDPDATEWRKLEALCGFDPDHAPASVIKMLLRDPKGLGRSALEEVAAEGRHSTVKVLRTISALADAVDTGSGAAFRGKMPKLSERPELDPNERPWQQAAVLARHARRKWNLGHRPVANSELASLLKTKPDVFRSETASRAPMSLALQREDGETFDFHLTSGWEVNRRFSACRLLGDHFYSQNAGRLMPATHAKTARQQFQRAFAQEFLCPFKALQERLQTDTPDEEEIGEASAYFGVSSLLVKTTLVNKGELDRDALDLDRERILSPV